MTRINQKAFSLIEVMVVLVVMTMAGLGLIELINSNLRAQKGRVLVDTTNTHIYHTNGE